jgi:hypothetical protein
VFWKRDKHDALMRGCCAVAVLQTQARRVAAPSRGTLAG